MNDMKIRENTIRINLATERYEEKQSENKVSSDKGHFFAGGIGKQNPLDSQIAQKRTTAMEKAKKLIGDVFAAEKSVDDDLKERAERMKESEQNIVAANKELKAFEEEKEKLKELYGITGEENEEELPEEYKMQRDELTRYGEPYRQIITEAEKTIEEEQKVIAAIKVERLKSDPMIAASKEADELLESVEEEVFGSLLDEAVDNIEEEAKNAKEKQEKLKEQEELEEAKQKEREERRKQADLSELPMQKLLTLEQSRGEMQQEVDNMLTDMKLLAEDVKGSMVDETL